MKVKAGLKASPLEFICKCGNRLYQIALHGQKYEIRAMCQQKGRINSPIK